MLRRAKPRSTAPLWQDCHPLIPRKRESRKAANIARYSWAPKSKKPGLCPGFPSPLNRGECGLQYRLGDLAERLVHAALDRLCGLGRNLLRERAKLLALLGERLELLARMGARQFDHFRQRLCGDQFAGEVERGIGIHARRLDDFQAVIG